MLTPEDIERRLQALERVVASPRVFRDIVVPGGVSSTSWLPSPRLASDMALMDIGAERARQIASEGWTAEHDDKHEHGELALAAAAYATSASKGDQIVHIRVDHANVTLRAAGDETALRNLNIARDQALEELS